MSDAQNDNAATTAGRTEMEDLPQAERELTDTEANDIQGGFKDNVRTAREHGSSITSAQNSALGDVNNKFGDGSV